MLPNLLIGYGTVSFIDPMLRPLPEMDEQGNVIWRSAWKNELMKLQTLTAEQDKLMAEPEWYREMLFRVRTAMMAPIDANGHLQMTSAYTMAEPIAQQHQQHQHQQPPQQGEANHNHQGQGEDEQE